MDGFDRACEDLHYFRYADDILVLAPCRQEAEQARERLVDLAESLGLSLNPRKTFVRDVRSRPIYFLGYALSGGLANRWQLADLKLAVEKNGAGEGNRTPDLRFTKPLLYRLSYAGRTAVWGCYIFCCDARTACKHRPKWAGRSLAFQRA